MSGIVELLGVIRRGDMQVFQDLLASNPGLANARDDQGNSPLLMATYAGRGDMARALLDRGERPGFVEACAIGLEADVRRHLRENPGAMDSIEGIAAWWLPRHEVRVGVELVARALERLEMDGLIERTGDPDRPLYRLRQVAQLRGTEGQDFRGLR